jgi:hypothetical protein
MAMLAEILVGLQQLARPVGAATKKNILRFLPHRAAARRSPLALAGGYREGERVKPTY